MRRGGHRGRLPIRREPFSPQHLTTHEDQSDIICKIAIGGDDGWLKLTTKDGRGIYRALSGHCFER